MSVDWYGQAQKPWAQEIVSLFGRKDANVDVLDVHPLNYKLFDVEKYMRQAHSRMRLSNRAILMESRFPVVNHCCNQAQCVNYCQESKRKGRSCR